MTKIDITPLKKAGIGGLVKHLIEDQKREMDFEDFLASVKSWEKIIKRESD